MQQQFRTLSLTCNFQKYPTVMGCSVLEAFSERCAIVYNNEGGLLQYTTLQKIFRPSKNWKISSAMVVVGWWLDDFQQKKIASKFNPYSKKSNDSIFFKSNFLRLHALPDTDKLILRLNDELLSHVHQMSAIKRFFYSTWIEWIIA